MPDIKEALRDFVATSNSGKYTDEKTLLSKFPELKGYDVNALRDFVATSNSGKYKSEDELFSKFPEFNPAPPPTTEPTSQPRNKVAEMLNQPTSQDIQREKRGISEVPKEVPSGTKTPQMGVPVETAKKQVETEQKQKVKRQEESAFIGVQQDQKAKNLDANQYFTEKSDNIANYLNEESKVEYNFLKALETYGREVDELTARTQATGNPQTQADLQKAKFNKYKAQVELEKFTKQRNAKIDEQINSLSNMIQNVQEMGGNDDKIPGMQESIKKLQGEKENYLQNPDQKIMSVFSANKQDMDEFKVPGNTPRERVKNYALIVNRQIEEIDEKIKTKFPGEPLEEPSWTGGYKMATRSPELEDLWRRKMELIPKMQALAQVALVDRLPQKNTGGFFGAMTDQLKKELLPDKFTQRNLEDMDIQDVGAFIEQNQIAMGLSDEMIKQSALKGTADYQKPTEFFSSEGIGGLFGTSLSLAMPFGIAGKVTKVAKLPKAIQAISTAAQATKYGKHLVPIIKASEQGIKYAAAEPFIKQEELKDEANFLSGFLGAILSKPVEKALSATNIQAMISKMFGDKAPIVVNQITKFGNRLANSFGEYSSEVGESIGSIVKTYTETKDFAELKKSLNDQFGSLEPNMELFVGSVVMGFFMGSGTGIGDAAINKSKEIYAAMPPEQQKTADEILKQFKDDLETSEVNAKRQEIAEGETAPKVEEITEVDLQNKQAAIEVIQSPTTSIKEKAEAAKVVRDIEAKEREVAITEKALEKGPLEEGEVVKEEVVDEELNKTPTDTKEEAVVSESELNKETPTDGNVDADGNIKIKGFRSEFNAPSKFTQKSEGTYIALDAPFENTGITGEKIADATQTSNVEISINPEKVFDPERLLDGTKTTEEQKSKVEDAFFEAVKKSGVKGGSKEMAKLRSDVLKSFGYEGEVGAIYPEESKSPRELIVFDKTKESTPTPPTAQETPILKEEAKIDNKIEETPQKVEEVVSGDVLIESIDKKDENYDSIEDAVRGKNFIKQKVSIDEIVAKDKDLQEYLSDNKPTKGRKIEKAIIVGDISRGGETQKGGVIDGFHRIAQAIANGETEIEAFVEQSTTPIQNTPPQTSLSEQKSETKVETPKKESLKQQKPKTKAEIKAEKEAEIKDRLLDRLAAYNNLSTYQQNTQKNRDEIVDIIGVASKYKFTIADANVKSTKQSKKYELFKDGKKQTRTKVATETTKATPEQIKVAERLIEKDMVTLWDGSPYTPHLDAVSYGITWQQIRKGEQDIKAGKVDSVPARKLIEALNQIESDGIVNIVSGSGSMMQRDGYKLSEARQAMREIPELTDADIEEINANEEALAKEYDEWLSNLTEEEQLNILEENESRNQSDVGQNVKSRESQKDVPNEEDGAGGSAEEKVVNPLKDVESTAKALDGITTPELEETVGTVYHATLSKFDEFDESFLGSNTKAESAKEGFFFATNPEVAISYASKANEKRQNLLEKSEVAQQKIIDAIGMDYKDYNRAKGKYKIDMGSSESEIAKNQKIIDEAMKDIDAFDLYDMSFKYEPIWTENKISDSGSLKKVVLEIKNPLIYDFEGEKYRDKSFAEIIKEAKAQGHDGVILKNTYDGNNPYANDIKTDIHVVFNKKQITPAPKAISEAYHKAKKDGSNPKLVKAVEDAISQSQEQALKDTIAKELNKSANELGVFKDIISKLESLKIDTKNTLSSFGLLPETWNTAIDIVIGVVKLSGATAESVRKGIAKAVEYINSTEDKDKFQKEDFEAFVFEKLAEETSATKEPPMTPKEVDEYQDQKVKEITSEVPQETTTDEDKEPRKREKALLNRAFRGVTNQQMKDAIAKHDLEYFQESWSTAKAIANDFINEVGLDNALDAVRRGMVVGAPAAYIWSANIDEVGRQIAATSDEQTIKDLQEIQSELLEEFGVQTKKGGQFIAALRDIYANSDFGYDTEYQIKKFKDTNGGEIPKEVEEKMRKLGKEYDAIKAKLEETEKKLKEVEEKQAVVDIAQDIARKKQIEKQQSISEKGRKIAEKIREGKVSRPSMFLSSSPAAIVWDGAVEIAAQTIYGTSKVIEGIALAVKYLKESEWYSKLNKDDQDLAEKQLKDYLIAKTKEAPTVTVTDTGIQIPHQIIRDYVSQGITDIDKLVEAIKIDLLADEIQVTERQIRDAITKYGKTINPNKEEIETQIRKMKRIGRIYSALEDIENQKRPLKSGQQRDKLDAEERKLNKELREALKTLPIDAEAASDQLKTSLDAVKQRLRNQIEDLQKEIETGEKRAKSKGIEYDEDAKALVEERDRIKAIRDEIFGDKEISLEEKIKAANKVMDRAIKNLEEKIRSGELETEKRTPLSSPELDAKREALNKLRQELKTMREIAGITGKQRLESAKKRTIKQIANLEKRIKEGDFAKAKKKPLLSDTELDKIRAEKIRIQNEFDKLQYQNELKNRTKSQKVYDSLWEMWNLTRALRATGELSPVLLQGGVYTIGQSITNPMMAVRAFAQLFTQGFSEKKHEAWLRKVQAQEFYPRLKQSKLAITETDVKVNAKEELFLSGWVNQIWDGLGLPLRAFGENPYKVWEKLSPPKFFERATIAYLNSIRLEKYLQGEQMLRAQGIEYNGNEKQYKAMADVINTFTGRGSLGKLELVSKPLAAVFFSPRMWSSSIQQTIALPYFYAAAGVRDTPSIGGGRFKPTVAQKMILMDYMKYVGLTAAILMLVKANEDDDDKEGMKVEMDPRSSDFGKIKFGDTRIDPWGGRIQQVVLISRMMTDSIITKGEKKTLGSTPFTPTKGGLLLKFAQNKLSPSSAMVAKFLFSSWKKDKETDEMIRVDQYGQPIGGPLSMTTDNLYPIYWETISELHDEHKPVVAGFLDAAAFFGLGIGVYEDKDKAKKK